MACDALQTRELSAGGRACRWLKWCVTEHRIWSTHSHTEEGPPFSLPVCSERNSEAMKRQAATCGLAAQSLLSSRNI